MLLFMRTRSPFRIMNLHFQLFLFHKTSLYLHMIFFYPLLCLLLILFPIMSFLKDNPPIKEDLQTTFKLITLI